MIDQLLIAIYTNENNDLSSNIVVDFTIEFQKAVLITLSFVHLYWPDK
jgi:hypothetical protein